MAEAKIGIVLTGRDESKQAFGSAESSMGSLMGAAKALGGVIVATFAVKKIVDFGVASFKAFTDAQVAMSRVDAVLGTMGKKGADARAGILKAAQAATKLGFDDEAAAESVTKLFQRTGDLTQAIDLNNVAMDLARAKHIDLESASTLVGQVLSGNGKILKQYGIDLKDSATPLEALGELQNKVSGQAKGFSETTVGALEKMKVAYGNLQESIGEVLAKALTPFINWIGEFIGNLPSLEQVGAFFRNLFLTIDEKTGLITLMREAWDEVVAVFNDTLMPAVLQLWEALKPYQPLLETLGKLLGTILVVAIAALVLSLKGLLELATILLSVLTKMAAFITDVFVKSWEGLKGIVLDVVNAVEKAIDAFKRLSIVQGAKNLFNSTVDFITAPFKAKGGPVSGGNPYIVGEKGPELFVPNSSGSIVPNGGFGGINVYLNTNNLFTDNADQLGEMVGNALINRLNLNMRL